MIIQALLAGVISLIISTSIMTLMLNQNKQVIWLNQKLDLLDTIQNVRRALSNENVCKFNLATNNGTTLDISQLPNSATFNPPLEEFFSRDNASSNPLFMLNEEIPSAKGVVLRQIAFENWNPISPDLYEAKLTLHVESFVKGAVAPVNVGTISISTDPATPTNQKVITSCTYSAENSGNGTNNPLNLAYQTCQQTQGAGVNRASCVATCPGGMRAIGGGCSSSGSSEERLYVRVNSVTSGGTAWECSVTEDYSLPSAASSVANGYVVCAQDTSQFEFQTCQDIRGAGANRAACTAHCSPGKRVLSGGCNSNGSSEERLYVRVSSPTAAGDGWECSVTEDYTLPSAAQSVANGFAVCY